MNTFVTGGAGFIGSHVVERLLDTGSTVVCYDNFDDFYDPQIKRQNIREASGRKNFYLVEDDIRDAELLKKTFDRFAIDMVIHLAARAGVRPSLLRPELYYDVNVMGTLSLLEAMRKCNIRRMLFASSSSVYGNQSKVPFSENDNVDHPISPYAASKKAGELLCHSYSHLYGFDIFCLRLFTVYGPRQRPEMAIHQFVRKIIDDETITLYGDGSSERDYTFIDDILDGITGSISALKGYEIINLGESRTITLKKLISVIENITGKTARIRWESMQPGDVQTTYADITKAARIIGYRPHFPVESGLGKFVEWYRNNYIK